MGCKSVSSKKPIVVESNNPPSQGKIKDHVEPASLPVDIKIIAKYESDIVLEQFFKENDYVKDVINEIKRKLTGETYSYKLDGKALVFNTEDKLTSLLEKNSKKSINKDKSITFEIDVSLPGLPNLPEKLLKAFYSYNYIAKPLTDPFEIAIFDKTTGKIQIESLSSHYEQIENETNLLIYSELSAYCSGMDHLYISGGENVNATSLWDIDLADKTIYKSKSSLKNPRKLHSMIFIPNNYVLIVGGLEAIDVECYDISKKEIFTHSALNEERIEPALMIINDTYLYVFSGFYMHKEKYLDSFERMNLRSGSKTWEILKPSFKNLNVENSLNSAFTQKFFAVSMHSHNSVIFLGGIHGASFDSNNNFCFTYNYEKNTISLSNVPHNTSDFGEKFFYPLDSYNNILIPYINRDEVSIIRYTADDGIKKIPFEFDSDIKISLSIYRQNEFRLLLDDELMNKKDIYKPQELISKKRIALSELKDDNGAVIPMPMDDNINAEKPLPNSIIKPSPSQVEVNETDDSRQIKNTEFIDVKGEPIENDTNDQQKDVNENELCDEDKMNVENNGHDVGRVENGKFYTNDGYDILNYKYNIENYLQNVMMKENDIQYRMAAESITPDSHINNIYHVNNNLIGTPQ